MRVRFWATPRPPCPAPPLPDDKGEGPIWANHAGLEACQRKGFRKGVDRGPGLFVFDRTQDYAGLRGTQDSAAIFQYDIVKFAYTFHPRPFLFFLHMRGETNAKREEGGLNFLV